MGQQVEFNTKVVIKEEHNIEVTKKSDMLLVDIEKQGYRIYPMYQEMSWHYDNEVGMCVVIGLTWAKDSTFLTLQILTGQDKFRKKNLKLIEKRG